MLWGFVCVVGLTLCTFVVNTTLKLLRDFVNVAGPYSGGARVVSEYVQVVAGLGVRIRPTVAGLGFC